MNTLRKKNQNLSEKSQIILEKTPQEIKEKIIAEMIEWYLSQQTVKNIDATSVENKKYYTKKYYTVSELYEVLDQTIPKPTIYYLIKKNNIPCKQIGKRKLIPAKWIYEKFDIQG